MDRVMELITLENVSKVAGVTFTAGAVVGAVSSVRKWYNKEKPLEKLDNEEEVHFIDTSVNSINICAQGLSEATKGGVVGGLYLVTLPVSYPAYTYIKTAKDN